MSGDSLHNSGGPKYWIGPGYRYASSVVQLLRCRWKYHMAGSSSTSTSAFLITGFNLLCRSSMFIIDVRGVAPHPHSSGGLARLYTLAMYPDMSFITNSEATRPR